MRFEGLPGEFSQHGRCLSACDEHTSLSARHFQRQPARGRMQRGGEMNGTSRPDSDLDVRVEIEPAHLTVFEPLPSRGGRSGGN